MKQEVTPEHLKGLREAIQADLREFNQHVTQRFDQVDRRFDRVERDIKEIRADLSKVKVAVVDLLSTERYVKNLVRELKAQGIALKEEKIFST